MFETNGTIGKTEIEELMVKDMPTLNRNTLIVTLLFIIVAFTFEFGTWQFTLILLLSLLPLRMRMVMQKKYFEANMNAILRVTGGVPILPLTTRFEEDRVIMKLPNAVPQVEILYSDLSKMTVTEHMVVLGSRAARKAVYIFRSELKDANAFLDFLKSLNTQIPAKQLSLLEKEPK